jgi:hypothetical protein
MTTTNKPARPRPPETPADQNCLAGKWFHTTKECPRGHRTAVWQGHIMGCPAPGILLVELFEWVIGEPCGQELITLNDFMAKKPILYDDHHEMQFSYEHGSMRHHCDETCDALKPAPLDGATQA